MNEHRWTLGNGAHVGVQAKRPTVLLYGENLDTGSEHMPAVAGLEAQREIFVAELVGALKLDREEIDRGPKLVGNVVLEAVQRLAGRVEELEELALKVSDADRLADEVAALVTRRVLDSRSAAADALLDYRETPRTERSDRLAALEQENERLRKRLEEAEEALTAALPDVKARAWGRTPYYGDDPQDRGYEKEPTYAKVAAALASLRGE